MRSEFARFLSTSHTYDSIRARNPLEGRRMWLLRAVNEFWASSPSKPEAASEAQDDNIDPSADDEDPMDQVIDDVDAGIVLRTDFSDEDAWNSFLGKLKRAEEEHGDVGERGEEADENSDDAEEEEDGPGPGLLIKVIDASLPEERALFEGISNLRALRLFNDVDVRPAPPPPPANKRTATTPHRLVDRGGWREVYSGVTIWVYDAQSNNDHCLRLVNPEGDVYGTATGDSWRAQVSHVYELQFNMTFLGMKINFGGMDRWDFAERSRNLREAE